MAGYWPSSFFSVFMDGDGVEVHKLTKRQGQYPVILTKQAWSIEDLFYCFLGKFFFRDMAGSPKWARYM